MSYAPAATVSGKSDWEIGADLAGSLIPALINGYAARRADGGVEPVYAPQRTAPVAAVPAVSAPIGKTVLIVGAVFAAGVMVWVGAAVLGRR